MERKIELLKQSHLPAFTKTRQEVEIRLSGNQSMFCVCGRLATGLHESYCRKFQREVDKETVRQLKHLLKTEDTNSKV